MLCVFTTRSFGQSDDDCFARATKQHYAELNRLKLNGKFYPDLDSLNKRLDYHDQDSLMAVGKRTIDRVTGCKYPDTTFVTTSGKKMDIDHTNSKYVIINFNDVFCDACLLQLEDLQKINDEEKQNATILAFFPQDKGQLQYLMDKYPGILFVPDARSYILRHNLGQGYPISFVLDNNKLILRISRGAFIERGKLYDELAPLFD
ncbi:MAG: peroxiredoxin family protein [Bacteroidia bacterium]